jgi:Cilia- and flagella-associated protein 91
MFTDLVTKRRNFYFPQRNPLPITSDDIQSPKMMCDRAMNTNHFVFTPILAQREEIYKLDVPYQPMMKSTRSVKCQTKYRESSAQTEAWLPNAKLRDGEMCVPETAFVNCETEPGLREVEAIERARIRREWENQLPTMTQDQFPLRIAQLEAFEWENLIAREREMNENQMNRMEQVEQMLDERQEMNRSYSDMMIENVHKRSIVETEQKKSQMEISYARKMRKLMKKNDVEESSEFKAPKIEASFIDMLQKEKDVQVLFKSKVPLVSSVNITSTLSRENLWEPKKRVKEIAHGVRTDKNLKALYQSMIEISNREESTKIRCRTKREKKKINKKFEEIDESQNQDLILVQKTVKGIAAMNFLNRGIKESFDKIQDFRLKFSIDSVQDILPEQYTNLFEEATKSPEKSQVSLVQKDDEDEEKKENAVGEVKPMIDEILNRVDEVITEKFNKRLLREAENERSKRQEENRHKMLLEQNERARQAEIERKIDEQNKKTAGEILSEFLPCLIEKIAEEDSVNSIKEDARIIDDEAWSSTKNERETVDKIVKEFILPEIEKRVERHSKLDEEISALVAAHDAFESHVENIPFHEIHHAQIVCEDLLQEIVNNLNI